MAIAQFSGIGVTEARNKLGDYVFTRNRGGQTLRIFVIPTNTLSTHRTNTRNNFATAVSLWSSLDVEAVTQWNIFSKRYKRRNSIAQQYTPSGRAMFIECNCNLLAAQAFPIEFPVFNKITVPVSSVKIDLANSSELLFSPSFLGAGFVVPEFHILTVSASPCVSNGINYPKNFFQPIAVFPELTDMYRTDLWLSYSNNYYAPVPGQAIFLKVSLVNYLTGLRSVPVICKSVVS